VDVNRPWPAAAVPADLGTDERTITIYIPALHTLTIRWPGCGDRAVLVSPHRSGVSPILRKLTGEVAVIERLPPRKYDLRPRGGNRSLEVKVPAQTEVTIQ
jgi:hypothetical protein